LGVHPHFCTMLFFAYITQSWRKLFFSVWHWVRQEVGFVPPNEELEIAPPKIWMYPQKWR
jgi:hypothetical protein